MLNKSIISQYISDLKPRIKRIRSINNTEESLRPVFIELLTKVGDHKKLWVIAEERLSNNKKPDASIKNLYTIHGYYESKSPNKNLKLEINKKIKKSKYPIQNTIFENSNSCVLYQDNQVAKEISKMWDDPGPLSELLNLFFNYESQEIKKFHKAQKQFNSNLPELANEIREELIQMEKNRDYMKKIDSFVSECREFINPYFERKNVEDWLIQHILTEQIFLKVFDEQQYHKSNNISKTISSIEKEFLLDVKNKILKKIKPYIAPITNYGNNMIDLNERQLFLKKIYQDFYNSYNKKLADRFGIIYTPNEIVKFMVKSTNKVIKKHFNKELKDKNVHILDPATGTGTFVTEIIEYIDNQSDKETVKYKYINEIHANEISVLPYYVANLSIEYTYEQLTGKTDHFKNLVLVDSLQNSSVLKGQLTFEGLAFSENQKRVKKQNEKSIKIIIGNPPYNQHQKRFDDDNPNKKYPALEERIRETYGLIKSTKEKLSQDKYIKFLRWATDRIDDQGVISFIINRSFLDADSGKGVRACLEKEFDYIYIIDLGGNIRKGDPKDSNVFDIQAGVAIVFFVKSEIKNMCARIKYIKLSEKVKKDKKSYKLAELNQSYIDKYKFKTIVPNKKHQWLNQETEFEGLSLNDVFNKSFLGIFTNRDKEVYDLNKETLEKRLKFLIKDLVANPSSPKIKLSRDLKKKIEKGKTQYLKFDKNKISVVGYRKNEMKYFYSEKILSDVLTNQFFEIYGNNLQTDNLALCWCVFSKNRFEVDLVKRPVSADYFGVQSGAATRISSYVLLKKDVVKIFQTNYNLNLKREDIFSYIVGLFHSKKYKEFIASNNFNKKNLPVPLWDNYKDYIKKGKEKIKALKSS